VPSRSPAACGDAHGEAHKAVTSKYTYNDDVFSDSPRPLWTVSRAGRRRAESLMTYDDAFRGRNRSAPSWIGRAHAALDADGGFGELKHAHALSPNELDVHPHVGNGWQPARVARSETAGGHARQRLDDGQAGSRVALPEYAMPADPMEETKSSRSPRARPSRAGCAPRSAAGHARDRPQARSST